jgi:glycerophosphoryl diester phosphodiesterase
MRPNRLVTGAVAALAITAGSASAAPQRATLLARAVLPAATFAPGPPSGAFIGPGPINGQPVPFPSQPVQGFSAILRAGGRSYLAMLDNGYGTKANSADFLLRVYRIQANWERAAGGPGTVDVLGSVSLRDPRHEVPWPIVNEGTADRLLTGADFDPESMRRAPDGTFWFGDEFGPFLLHTNRRGILLDPPYPLPGVQSPDSPLLGTGTPNLPASGGFEGTGLSADHTTLYPMLEKARLDDPNPSRRWISEFSLVSASYTGRTWQYLTDDPHDSVTDITRVAGSRFVVLERDSDQGPAAVIKRIYEIDLNDVGPDGFLRKHLVVDLLDMADPNLISLPARPGDIGLGATFTFPFITTEAVLPLGGRRLLIANDNNYPFSTGRNPGLPDDDEMIVVRAPALVR